MPCSVGARVGFQPAHREREQQYDDHQQGEEDAPAQRYRHLLRIACTEHQPEGVKQLADITLYDNTGMLALARRLGFKVQRDPGNPNVTRLRLALDASAS